jgi:hypothetical protein
MPLNGKYIFQTGGPASIGKIGDANNVAIAIDSIFAWQSTIAAFKQSSYYQ